MTARGVKEGVGGVRGLAFCGARCAGSLLLWHECGPGGLRRQAGPCALIRGPGAGTTWACCMAGSLRACCVAKVPSPPTRTLNNPVPGHLKCPAHQHCGYSNKWRIYQVVFHD